jgi:hypothetical protein
MGVRFSAENVSSREVGGEEERATGAESEGGTLFVVIGDRDGEGGRSSMEGKSSSTTGG